MERAGARDAKRALVVGRWSQRRREIDDAPRAIAGANAGGAETECASATQEKRLTDVISQRLHSSAKHADVEAEVARCTRETLPLARINRPCENVERAQVIKEIARVAHDAIFASIGRKRCLECTNRKVTI
jgi:hypothetical protein